MLLPNIVRLDICNLFESNKKKIVCVKEDRGTQGQQSFISLGQ